MGWMLLRPLHNTLLALQGSIIMSSSNKIWLLYSLLGSVVSISLVILFEVFPTLRILSDAGTVFGVMVVTMGASINKAFEVSPLLEKDSSE
jgi:hypothetical protein